MHHTWFPGYWNIYDILVHGILWRAIWIFHIRALMDCGQGLLDIVGAIYDCKMDQIVEGIEQA